MRKSCVLVWENVNALGLYQKGITKIDVQLAGCD